MGLSTCNSTKTVPANASGPARESPCCTAPTSTPMAIANAAGRVPLSSRAIHQPAARPGAAFGRTLKKIHSLRAVSRWSTPYSATETGFAARYLRLGIITKSAISLRLEALFRLAYADSMDCWIVADLEHLGGSPRVRGTRISVAFILEALAA